MTRAGRPALLLAVLALAGCASKPAAAPEPLSRADFTHRASHICAVAARRTKGLKKATTPAMFDREMNVVFRSEEHAIGALRGLTPPSAVAASFGRLLVDLDTEDVAGHQLVDAIDAHQVGRAKHLQRKGAVLTKRINRRFRSLGLRTCAKDH